MAFHFFYRQHRVTADNKNFYRLAQHFVRHTNHSRLKHARNLQHHILDFFRADAIATCLDDVARAPRQKNETF